MHVSREVRGTVAILIVLMLCAFMLVALSLLVTMMWHHSECCVCMAYVYTESVHKGTATEKLLNRLTDVAKLSIAILKGSIGPVRGNRPRRPARALDPNGHHRATRRGTELN